MSTPRNTICPSFVKENVVNAPDVAAALVQIEPPYPGYQRTGLAILADQGFNGAPLPFRSGKTVLPAIHMKEFRSSIASASRWRSAAGLRAAPPLRLGTCRRGSSVSGRSRPIYQGALVEGVKNFQLRHGRTSRRANRRRRLSPT